MGTDYATESVSLGIRDGRDRNYQTDCKRGEDEEMLNEMLKESLGKVGGES